MRYKDLPNPGYRESRVQAQKPTDQQGAPRGHLVMTTASRYHPNIIKSQSDERLDEMRLVQEFPEDRTSKVQVSKEDPKDSSDHLSLATTIKGGRINSEVSLDHSNLETTMDEDQINIQPESKSNASDDEDAEIENHEQFSRLSRVRRLLHKLSQPKYGSLLQGISISRLRCVADEISSGSLAETRIILHDDVATSSWLNRTKLMFEDLTKESWDWWPLRPPRRNLLPGLARIEWRCVSSPKAV
jgi:hypothetical protein